MRCRWINHVGFDSVGFDPNGFDPVGFDHFGSHLLVWPNWIRSRRIDHVGLIMLDLILLDLIHWIQSGSKNDSVDSNPLDSILLHSNRWTRYVGSIRWIDPVGLVPFDPNLWNRSRWTDPTGLDPVGIDPVEFDPVGSILVDRPSWIYPMVEHIE